MDLLDLEIKRYSHLVDIYPSNQLYCPVEFKNKMKISNFSTSYFDINLTRYLYIKTFNSIPPDEIWSFRILMGTEEKKNEFEENLTIQVIVGLLNNNKLETDIVNLEVKPSDTFEKINKELNSKGFDCKLLINGNCLIDLKSKIGDIKTIYGVCFTSLLCTGTPRGR